MEVTALCTRLPGSVILESPVLPVMEGEAVTLRCRNKTTSSSLTADFYKDGVLISSSDTGNLTIYSVSRSDEGLYKCNISGAGESAESRLAVRGAVILEIPVHPVMEGDSVTLRCRKNKTPANHIADFYRHGFHIGTGYKGNLTIHSVSKSDEGPYKCSISGVGESAQSWLTVRVVAVILESPVCPVMEGDPVTLHCMNKVTTNITADFYKDGLFVGNRSTGNLTIRSVSKSDEGLYKCNIFGAGESKESHLAVKECPKENVPLCSDQLPVLLYLLMKTLGTALWAALLLFVLSKHQPWKHRDDD